MSTMDRRIAAQAGSLFRSFRDAAARYSVPRMHQPAAALIAATLSLRAGVYAPEREWEAFVAEHCPSLSLSERRVIRAAAMATSVRFDYRQWSRIFVVEPDEFRSGTRPREPRITAEVIGFFRANPDLASVSDYGAFLERWKQHYPDRPAPSRQRVAAARTSIRRLGSVPAPAACK